MRSTIFALFACAGTLAIGQSTGPASANPSQYWSIPPGITQTGSNPFTEEFLKQSIQPSRNWHFNPSIPQQTLTVPRHDLVSPGDVLKIDPQIIVHPPLSSLGEQQPGTLIAQNLYPGLQFLPIQKCKGMGEPIPTIWPNGKVRQIPTVWPNFKMLPAQRKATAKAEGK